MALAQAVTEAGVGVNGSAYLTAGMKSATDPIFIDDRGYVSSMNTVNRGGLVQTRPGYTALFQLPPGNLQGLKYFRPLGAPPYLVFAVEGKVYASKFPFTRYDVIPGIQFYRAAKHVFWAIAIQSANLELDGTITIIEPKRVLVMQDGGYTRAAYWDGVTSRHLDPTQNEVPLGGPMAWSGGRLWVGYKNELLASDINNPLKFSENDILAIGGSYFFERDITGLAEIPGLATPQLACFTEDQGWLIQSGIRDRTQWKSQINPPFQSILFPALGCVSQRSLNSQYGLLWWMTAHHGLTNFNVAQQASVTSAQSAMDIEMAVSKGSLSPNISDVSVTGFENYQLVSVPSGDIKNRHTWVMDKTVIDNTFEPSAPVWNSFWTGTFPVEWTSGNCNGSVRIFHVSKDDDGQNRLWEAFTPDREDNGCPITCYLETKTHIDFNPKATGLDFKRFNRAEVTFNEIVGNVSVAIYWAGTRGRYKKLGEYNLVASEGQLVAGKQIKMTDTLFGQRPQSRILKTVSLDRVKTAQSTASTAGVESVRTDDIDIGFSLLIVWSGRAGVRSYRIWAEPEQEKGEGEVIADETGTVKIVLDAFATDGFDN